MGLDFWFLLWFPSRFLISGRRFQLISTDFTTQCTRFLLLPAPVQICNLLPFPCRLSSGTCLSGASEGQPTVPASPPPPRLLPVCRRIPGHLVTMYSNSCPSLWYNLILYIHVTAMCVSHRVIYIFNHHGRPSCAHMCNQCSVHKINFYHNIMSSYIIRQHTSFAGDY